MLSDNMEDWEGELTPKDIILATTASRKSMRRSMIPLDQIGSPVHCTPSKVAIRRKSVAVFMGSSNESPIASSTRQFRSLSFDSSSQGCENPMTTSPKESTPHPTVAASPVRASSSDHDPLPSTSVSLPKSPYKVSKPKSSSESNGSFPYCESVDDVMRNYERELEEWPKFLDSLEVKARTPFRSSLNSDDIMNDSVLKHFIEFILPDQSTWPSCLEIQRRIERAYIRIISGLIRTKIAQEKIARYVAALREIKLKELLPKLAENPSPVSSKDLAEYVAFLEETDELS